MTFDLSEYQRTATEKLVHAQLVVMAPQLVDSAGTSFTVEKYLAQRGLPIYVYEQNDEEQLISEESKEVRAALEDTIIGQEARRQGAEDVMTEVSDLEA